MPRTTVNGIEVYYEIEGEGSPLVLIQGLGYSSKFWFKQVPELKERFRLVSFDNRDVGRSEIVDQPYEIQDMARDCEELIDTLDLGEVNLLGLSMGGYIAQRVALDIPDSIKKLVLVSTHGGDPEYLEETADLWEEILDVEGLSLEEVYRKGFKYSLSEDFFEGREDLVEELIAMRMENPQPPEAFQRQFQAASNFSLGDGAGDIEAPTLVVSGENDRVVPPKFAKRLNRLIPSSRLEMVADAAHLLHIEQPAKLNSSVKEFLGEADA